MKKWNAIIGILTGIAILAGSFTGCGTPESNAQNIKNSQATESVAEETKSTEDTKSTVETAEKTAMSTATMEKLAKSSYEGELTIMHDSTTEEAQAYGAAEGLRTAIKNWEQSNPKITLNQTVLANDDYKTQIATQAAAGDLPDIFLLQGMNTKTWAQQGLILDLTSYVQESPFYQAYNKAYFTPFTYSGKIYGLPALTGTTCTVLVYDKAAWKKAGFEQFPSTWEEVKKADEYFKQNGYKETIAFGNKDQWQANSCFLSTIGDRFTGAEWFQSLIDGSGAKFSDKEFVDALTFTQDIFKSGIFNDDFNSITNEEAREYYISGSVPAFIGGDWDINYLQSVLKETNKELYENTGFAVLPQPNGASKSENSLNIGLGYSLAINSKLKENPDKLAAALNFIHYATGPDYANYVGTNYALQGLTKVEDIDLSKFDSYVKQYYKYTYVDTKPCEIYDSYISSAVWDVLNKNMQSMLNGDATPQDVAQKTQKTYEDDYLNSQRKG
ncbi:extracellular solute-binding protein [Oscillospiraceae bacterium PP1C4]